jgi:hypothetical protein
MSASPKWIIWRGQENLNTEARRVSPRVTLSMWHGQGRATSDRNPSMYLFHFTIERYAHLCQSLLEPDLRFECKSAEKTVQPTYVRRSSAAADANSYDSLANGTHEICMHRGFHTFISISHSFVIQPRDPTELSLMQSRRFCWSLGRQEDVKVQAELRRGGLHSEWHPSRIIAIVQKKNHHCTCNQSIMRDSV